MNTTRRDFLGKSLLLATGAVAAPVTKLTAAPAPGAAAPTVNRKLETVNSGGEAAAAPARRRRASFLAPTATDKLTGFIVSDSHFGWLNPQQPTPAEQARAMDTIMARFPALDVFIDSGDAHHDYAVDSARGAWTDTIQAGCDAKPFYFVAGNHENNNSLTLDDKFYDYDSEFRTSTLGSVECQPYYSIDIKGIHIISLPQVMDQAYVSEASIAWLKLDLAVHKDKTTLIISHNAIKGTTAVLADPAYRQVSNSDVLLALFKQHPQIIAWMHGHNHSYEIVPRDNIIYVSNGRIGGFDPNNKTFLKFAPGGGTLGGIYFEVTRDALTVRCFNASQNKFFDEYPGGDHLRHTLPIPGKTSFDPAEPHAVNFGIGGSPHGQRICAYRHHAGGERTLYLTGAATPVINENPDFQVYVQRSNPDWCTKHLSGYSFEPNEEDAKKIDHTWEWHPVAQAAEPARWTTANQQSPADPPRQNHAVAQTAKSASATPPETQKLKTENSGNGGIVRVLRRPDPASTKAIFAPGATLGQRSYYRCAPGQKYKLTVALDAGATGCQRATPEYRLFDKHFVRMSREQGKTTTLPAGRSELTWEFSVPPLENIATLYTDPVTDNDLMLTTGVVFGNVTADLNILSYRLTFADAAEAAATIAPVVVIDGACISGGTTSVSSSAPLREGEIRALPIAAAPTERTTYAIEAKGTRRVTWLEKHRAPRYQVRNATARYDANGLLIVGPMRNYFSTRQEAVLVPMTPAPRAAAAAATLPYVHRIRHAKQVTIREATPQDRTIEIQVGGLWIHDQCEIDIVSPDAPTKVDGLAPKDYKYDRPNALLTLHVKRETTYKITW